MKSADELKMERDGWVYYGRKPAKDRTFRAVFEFVERLPNGNVITTDGRRGHIEWESKKPDSPPLSSTKGAA